MKFSSFIFLLFALLSSFFSFGASKESHAAAAAYMDFFEQLKALYKKTDFGAFYPTPATEISGKNWKPYQSLPKEEETNITQRVSTLIKEAELDCFDGKTLDEKRLELVLALIEDSYTEEDPFSDEKINTLTEKALAIKESTKEKLILAFTQAIQEDSKTWAAISNPDLAKKISINLAYRLFLLEKENLAYKQLTIRNLRDTKTRESFVTQVHKDFLSGNKSFSDFYSEMKITPTAARQYLKNFQKEAVTKTVTWIDKDGVSHTKKVPEKRKSITNTAECLEYLISLHKETYTQLTTSEEKKKLHRTIFQNIISHYFFLLDDKNGHTVGSALEALVYKDLDADHAPYIKDGNLNHPFSKFSILLGKLNSLSFKIKDTPLDPIPLEILGLKRTPDADLLNVTLACGTVRWIECKSSPSFALKDYLAPKEYNDNINQIAEYILSRGPGILILGSNNFMSNFLGDLEEKIGREHMDKLRIFVRPEEAVTDSAAALE